MDRALDWLGPVIEALPDLTDQHTAWLERVEDALREAGPDDGFTVALPPLGDLDEPGPALAFTLAGFVCGWSGLKDTFGTVCLPSAAVALGEAAALHARTTAALAGRVTSGAAPAVPAAVAATLGARHGELMSALLYVLVATRMEAEGHPQCETWGRSSEAVAEAAARRTVADLSPLSWGIETPGSDLFVGDRHDSLVRAAGRDLLTAAVGHPSMRARPA